MIRLLMAVGIGFAFSALGTRLLIDILTRRSIGQPIRADGPQGHLVKAGTPTMGGLAIVGGAVIGYVLSDLIAGGVFTRSGLLVMAAICGAGFIGFLDDWIKVSQERNLGLNARLKTLGLLTVAISFAVATSQLTNVSTELSFARPGTLSIDFGSVGWVVWAVVFFMGDTGSLAIGTGLAALALTTNTNLLLPIIGGIYVAETLSVMLQVAWFKITKGKRLFRMAPIHHHFELLGWRETKVIIRFWIIAGALTALALGLFYADWARATDLVR